AVDEMSHYYMALEVRQTYVGIMVALPPRRWVMFRTLSAAELAKVLCHVAGQVSARREPRRPTARTRQPERAGPSEAKELAICSPTDGEDATRSAPTFGVPSPR